MRGLLQRLSWSMYILGGEWTYQVGCGCPRCTETPMFKTNAGQVVIRLTPDTWDVIAHNLDEITSELSRPAVRHLAGLADEVWELLRHNAELPAQLASERAEALGDE